MTSSESTLQSVSIRPKLSANSNQRRKSPSRRRSVGRARKKSKIQHEEVGPEDATFPLKVAEETFYISDEKAQRQWLAKQFGNLQQLNLKKIGKAWIKKVHPNKQSTHPYNGGPEAVQKEKDRKAALEAKGHKKIPRDPEMGHKTRPCWWPPSILHLEPDHLRKDGESSSGTASQ